MNTLTGTTVCNIGVAFVAHAAGADIPKPIGGVTTLTVGAHTSIALCPVCVVTRHVVTDGPIQLHRHHGVGFHLQVSCVERVVVPVHQEGIVAGAEAQPFFVGVHIEVHSVVGEARWDVETTTADASAGAIHRAF